MFSGETDDAFDAFDGDEGKEALPQQAKHTVFGDGEDAERDGSGAEGSSPPSKRVRTAQRDTTAAPATPAAAPPAVALDTPPTTTAVIPQDAIGGYESKGAAQEAAAAVEGAASHEAALTPGKQLFEDERSRCLHEVMLPHGLLPSQYAAKQVQVGKHSEPAKTYPFVLDAFQKKSVDCLEKGESVLVSAHTSAGKTVVAQYAIAMSLRDKQRVIYTSPIKALSNQKYRELSEEFGDVGLMTGDVTINPSSSCLVMTTEILRSMLYRGSEVMREVAWVIFDEVHYMRDKERGVVWEETILLLPHNVRYVFLSATIPNANEFSQWIANVHRQPCHVVYTDFRPTPLQHYIFPQQGDGLYLVVDEKGTFRNDNFQRALTALGGSGAFAGGKRGRAPGKGQSDIYRIVRIIMERNYEPVIIFSFSKRECERLALQMAKLDFNSDDEKALVDSVYHSAIDMLADDDKKLPQVEAMLPLLRRGIGIHHSGLLPIIKEVVEILFQEGLCKALFSTETFSMGLNMPARTCVFTSVRKFDGETFRLVSSGEYIQMSGRAGRRGLDARGIVILMVDEKIEPPACKEMIKGTADPLNSSFHLTYNMILNLLRVEDADPESLVRKSFLQFQQDASMPEKEKRLAALERDAAAISIPNESDLVEYYQLRMQAARAAEEMRAHMMKPQHCLAFLQPGRLVDVVTAEGDWGWGAVVNFTRAPHDAKARDGPGTGPAGSTGYVVDVLLHCAEETKRGERPRPLTLRTAEQTQDQSGVLQVVPVPLEALQGISTLRIFLPKDLRPKTSRDGVLRSMQEVLRRRHDGLPLLDPAKDMNIRSSSFRRAVESALTIEDRIANCPAQRRSDLKTAYAEYVRKHEMLEEAKQLARAVRASQGTILREELRRRKRVLRRLGYTTADDVVDLKGRISCEINTSDELLVCELIFDGVMNELEPSVIAALISCLVFQEKGDGTEIRLRDELQAPFRRLQQVAKDVATVMRDCKLDVDPDEYASSFQPGLMEVVYQWCRGASFAEVCKLAPTTFEGSIIRAMRRLEELIRQLAAAAKSIGNESLQQKFDGAIELIKRDIVFAASLYL